MMPRMRSVYIIAVFSLLFHSCASQVELTRSHFPDGFLFGTASSSYQYEGAISADGKTPSNWDVFSHQPGRVLGGDNGDVADDHYSRYLEDIELMHSLGVNAYRLSISWARILPRGVFGQVNLAGIEFYNKIIDNLVVRGIQPFVTIHHGDVPQELEDTYGSWLSSQIQDDFLHLADACFRYFGDRVKFWMTVNEPNLVNKLAYFTGIFPPGRCSAPYGNCTAGNSETEPFTAVHNMLLAHAKAVQHYRKNYQSKQGGRIGITICATMFLPLTDVEADRKASERALAFQIGWAVDPLVFGNYPREMRMLLGKNLPKFSLEESKMLRNTLDFIGINHYSTLYVKDCLLSPCESGGSAINGFAYMTGVRNGVAIGERMAMPDMYIVPDGIERMTTYVQARYNNTPMYMTENGYAESAHPGKSEADYLNDTERVKYHTGYLSSLCKAIRNGADVRGYFVWSLLDNFEWASGYSIRFGLHYVDYNTLKRSPKLSALWYAGLLTGQSSENLQLYSNSSLAKYTEILIGSDGRAGNSVNAS